MYGTHTPHAWTAELIQLMWGQPPSAVHASAARKPLLMPARTLMNLPRHDRWFRRIVRRNSDPIIQRSTRRDALRSPTGPTYEGEPSGTPAVNLRAGTRAATRDRQIVLARLAKSRSRPNSSSSSHAASEHRSWPCSQCEQRCSPSHSALQCHTCCSCCPLSNVIRDLRRAQGTVNTTPHNSA